MRSAVFASSPIETHTSVYRTFAPFTPSFGSSTTRMSTPLRFATSSASASTASSGRSSFGQQQTYLTPHLAQPIMSEFATLSAPGLPRRLKFGDGSPVPVRSDGTDTVFCPRQERTRDFYIKLTESKKSACIFGSDVYN